MDRRDQELLDKQMRRLTPPRNEGVIAVMLAVMFLVGIALGSVLSPHKSEPVQIARWISGAASLRASPGRQVVLTPITLFLGRHAFEFEVIESMSAAFVAACDALQLKIGKDPAARFVAEKVIEHAQRGVRDPDVLRTMTLREFGLSDKSASVGSAAPSE